MGKEPEAKADTPPARFRVGLRFSLLLVALGSGLN
jgi:hypothetical protein